MYTTTFVIWKFSNVDQLNKKGAGNLKTVFIFE